MRVLVIFNHVEVVVLLLVAVFLFVVVFLLIGFFAVFFLEATFLTGLVALLLSITFGISIK